MDLQIFNKIVNFELHCNIFSYNIQQISLKMWKILSKCHKLRHDQHEQLCIIRHLIRMQWQIVKLKAICSNIVCVTVVNVVIIASQPRPYCTLKISNSIELDFECSSMCATYSIYALEKWMHSRFKCSTSIFFLHLVFFCLFFSHLVPGCHVHIPPFKKHI